MKISKILFVLALLSVLLIGGTPNFDGNKSYEYLKKQTEFGPRNPGSIGYKNCKEWLINFSESNSDKVILQNFIGTDPKTDEKIPMTNIITRFNPEQTDRIMLSAHWDTRPWADARNSKTKRDKPISGANDGASGIAVLLHIMELINENDLDFGVDIILWDGEDIGREGHPYEFCQGSRYYSNNIIEPKPQEGILLDMIGDADLEIPFEVNSMNINSNLMIDIWNIASHLNYGNIFIKQYGPEMYDDHMPLSYIADIPTIDIIDFKYPNENKNYWHTHDDTADKCSARSLKIIGDVLVYWLYNK
ncbi:MAG: M28 family peptidase [Candidatus Marinimicrobia bacterium]|nr:M28 family peptidase [Candidatus Neomarinimicrobiota bacterium]